MVKGFRVCLPVLEHACKSAKHRVVKIVHSNLRGVADILNMVPRLKIVQLFRDPRGITNSRLRTDWYEVEIRGYQKTVDDIASMCSWMRDDIKCAKEMAKFYPDSYGTLQYEDFRSLKTSSCLFFRFLKMDCSATHIQQSFNLYESPDDISPGKHKLNLNITGNHPYLFRRQLNWKYAQAINSLCLDVIQELGYRVYETENDLRNTTIPDTISDKLPYDIEQLTSITS